MREKLADDANVIYGSKYVENDEKKVRVDIAVA